MRVEYMLENDGNSNGLCVPREVVRLGGYHGVDRGRP
jgi:hypothetical protein